MAERHPSGRGKLGGILLEGVVIQTGDPRDPSHCVTIIGIGVNCAAAPKGLPYAARALSNVGAYAPSAEAVFARLSDCFVSTLDLWANGEGFPAIREKWLEDAAGLGERSGWRWRAARNCREGSRRLTPRGG